MSRKSKIFLIAVVAILACIVPLSIIKKEVFVTIDLQVSEISFTVQDTVSNLLSINNASVDIHNIQINSYREAQVQVEGSDRVLSITPDDGDITGKVIFANVIPGSIELQKGDTINFFLTGDGNQTTLKLSNYDEKLQLMPKSDSVMIRLKNSATSDTLLNSRKTFNVMTVAFEPIEIQPLDGTISLLMSFNNDSCLKEELPITISKINCFVHEEKEMRSSILAGKIHIEELDKDISLSKNARLVFDPQDEFVITSFSICQDKVNVRLEGFSRNLKVGSYGNKYIPSLLEYLYKNNYLIILFNSFMTLITFILFLQKESKLTE